MRSKVRASKPARCRQRFLRFFPRGFRDATYLDWERDYKWDTHLRWQQELNQTEFSSLLDRRSYQEIAHRAIRVEQGARHSMIFSFEKMALRDAVRSEDGARTFAQAMYRFLHGSADAEARFHAWVEAVAALPRKQTRVLTWPLVTVFGFIAQPHQHIFLKPTVVRRAAERYGFDLAYHSRPTWDTYASLLRFGQVVQTDLADLRPRDMIDIQSFMWVQGSTEYD